MTGKPVTRISLFLVSLVFMSLTLSTAWAHQKKTAITTILFNERTANIEIMHRFLIHDAEHAVKQIRGDSFGEQANIIASENTRQAFSQYVSERFSILDQDGELLELTLLGSEIDGGSIWVYQETPIPTDLQSMTIRQNALRDIWREQVNRVNIERNKSTETLIFQGNIEWLEVGIPRRAPHSE